MRPSNGHPARVKSLAMLVGTFLITFGMLSVMWLTMAGNPDGKVAASPSHVPSPAPTGGRDPSVDRQPGSDARPPARITHAECRANSDGHGQRHCQPARGGAVCGIELHAFGCEHQHSFCDRRGLRDVAGSKRRVRRGRRAGRVVQAPRTGTLATSVTYQLDSSQLPVGAIVLRTEVLVCGGASGGSTYEIDGPSGVSQTILSSVAP